MKKVLFAFTLAFMLFSCKKDNAITSGSDDSTKHPVQFSIADFIKEHETLKSINGRVAGADSTLAKISDIYYLVYASDGSKVHYIHQDTANNKAVFGTISDSLAVGTYTIVLIASEKPLYIYGMNASNISSAYISPQLMGMGILPLGDLFYKKLQVTVNATANPDVLNVTLDRIVGQLQLNIIDALPASDPHGYINVAIAPIPAFFSLSNSSVNTPDPTWQYYMPARVNQTTIQDFILGSPYEFSLYILYQDKSTGASLVKTVDHITCSANKRTIVKGYLYGVPNNPGGPDYNIKLNQSWSADSTVINF